MKKLRHTKSDRGPSKTNSPIAFFADAMLGKLARWLRMLGHDTAYQSDIPDAELVERVVREDRWLLTRDAYLTQRKVLRGRFTLLDSDFILEQLGQLQADLGIRLCVDANTPSRCAVCNALLELVPPLLAAPHVPPFVAQSYSQFVRCPQCAKMYWPGSHWCGLEKQLHQVSRTLRFYPQ